MALPVWPTDVPSSPFVGSLQIARAVEPPLISEMNSGTSRRRRKYTLRVAQVTFSITLSDAQLATFQAFHEDTLGDGAARFTMPIHFGSEPVARSCVFAEPPGYQPLPGSGLTRVTLSLLVEDLRAPAPPVAPANISPPTISGTAKQGETLTATTGTWTGNPTPSFSYQWLADGSPIVGATSNTLLLTSAQFGKMISVVVTATNSEGSASQASSSVGPVTAAPVNTVAPVVTGSRFEGQTLSCSTGTWTGTAPITYAYQWKRGATNISGATTNTYTLVSADVGSNITCLVAATNAAGTASATSNAVGPVVFNPAALTKQTWYDPSDISTLFQDTAGTVPVTADGQQVARINDKSGNGRHLTQATSAKRPIYKTDGTLRWLLFDGIDDGLSGATTGLPAAVTMCAAFGPGAGEASWLAVYDSANIAARFVAVVQMSSASAANDPLLGATSYRVNGVSVPGTRGDLYTAMPAGSSRVLTAQMSGGATHDLSAWSNLCIADYSGFAYGGKLFGFVLAVLNSSDRDKLEAWMAAKAGVTI